MGFAALGINCQTIKENITQIKDSIKRPPKVLLVAKADAYGLGAASICETLTHTIDYIGVANLNEATQLRNQGITTPILLLSEPFDFELDTILALDIAVTVYTHSTIDEISAFASKKSRPIKTHLKIDTGMTRLGTPWQDAIKTINHWQNSPDMVIKEGVYSHFANSDAPEHPLNKKQIDRFFKHKATFNQQMIHFSNSDAIKNIVDSHQNTIRIGLGAYQNSFTLSAPIRHIQSIPENTSVGYGSTYTTSRPTTIAIIGMGYADGLSTQLSNQGHVIINDEKCPIVGKICMDMFMAELPSPIHANPQDMAIILSPENTPGLSLNEMAKITNQNPREVLTRLSPRVKRHYLV